MVGISLSEIGASRIDLEFQPGGARDFLRARTNHEINSGIDDGFYHFLQTLYTFIHQEFISKR